jgi:hypothetical protein
MVVEKYCRDCGDVRPVSDFTKDRRRADGLAFYCKTHARLRLRRSQDFRRGGPPAHRFPRDIDVPAGHKWCPDCATVKPCDDFVRNAGLPSGRAPYCKPCHNRRGKLSRDKVGGSRTYHLKKRYGITAEEADAILATQDGVCAICQAAPAEHVDHDHVTGAVRDLLCFNCNGGLGQFKDDPEVLRSAADYVERHRALRRSVSSRPELGDGPGIPPLRRRHGVSRDRRCSPGFARWNAMRASS